MATVSGRRSCGIAGIWRKLRDILIYQRLNEVLEI
jgi:hypothetical protein